VATRIYFIIAILISSTAMAQPGDPPDPDNPVPIGGIEILLISGGLLGIKRILGRGKKLDKGTE